jgi:excisionase family DNA binding protein
LHTVKIDGYKCLLFFMATFLTSLSEVELKAYLKDSIRELFAEQGTLLNSNNTPQYPARMDITKAAEYLNISKQTLYSKTSLRLIKHIKKGKRLHFLREDLDAWLAEGKQSTVKELIAENDAYIADGSKRKR